jgi:ribosomal protein S18 acetylase RimI-like enzyme
MRRPQPSYGRVLFTPLLVSFGRQYTAWSMDDVWVRPVQLPADLDQICNLYAEAGTWFAEQWPDDLRMVQVDQAFREELAQAAADSDCCLLVAEMDGGQLAGTASGRIHPRPDQGTQRFDGPLAHLGDLVVTRDHRRRGIGTLLLNQLEQWALQRGASTITLSVHAQNHAALALYQNQGFRSVHVQMRKEIAPGSGRGGRADE